MPVEAPTEAASGMTLTATLSDVTGLANLLKSVAIQTVSGLLVRVPLLP